MQQPELTIQSGSFKTLKEAVSHVRIDVFINEQGVPADLEFDNDDLSCLHLVIFQNSAPIATGRMQDDGHIGRIAVKKAYRHQKIGTQVMQFFINYAKEHAYSRLYLGAQLQAIGFYETLGFTVYGEIFLDANIEHKMMKLSL